MTSYVSFLISFVVCCLCSFAQIPTAVGGQGIDLDGDGMSDLWEAAFSARMLAPEVDADGDGISNLLESRAGTDPFDPASALGLRITGVDPLRKEWVASYPGVVGKRYRILGSPDLLNWSPVGTASVGSGGVDQAVLDFGTTLPDRYFVSVQVSDGDIDVDGLSAFEESLLGFTDTHRSSSGTPAGNDFARAVELLTNGQAFTLNSQVIEGQTPTPEEAARFLIQAGMGADFELIQQVAQTGFSAWIEEQFQRPPVFHTPRVLSFMYSEQEESGETVYISDFMWGWWDIQMRGADMLRQRVAYALSQILVVSMVGSDELEDSPWGLANYYDVLVRYAFGNYKELLYEVSTHPVMGLYLSHAKNRKADPATNRFPDENYAREIMQLFSIGLYELNQDGTRKKDLNGNDIPTYGNTEILEFARIFTGLTYDATHVSGVPWGLDPGDEGRVLSEEEFLDSDIFFNNPMQAFEPVHDTGAKQLLSYSTVNGTFVSGAVPAGQTTDADIRTAIDNLFYHPNVGPFLARLLIQRMVKSNPSPAYIHRVALAFNDNGLGVRGDMKSVIRAILLDPEARNRGYLNDPTNGRLREPYLRYLHFCRAFNLTTSNGSFQNNAEEARLAFQQEPLSAPSVFNFYLPTYSPLGPVHDAGLVAPEFAITTATTAVAAMNFWVQGAYYLWPMDPAEEAGEIQLHVDLAEEYALMAADPVALVDRLDLILTYGSMNAASRNVILNALQQGEALGMGVQARVHLALYLFVNSPDFAVLR